MGVGLLLLAGLADPVLGFLGHEAQPRVQAVFMLAHPVNFLSAGLRPSEPLEDKIRGAMSADCFHD